VTALLLGDRERRVLAGWLLGKERPHGITPERWQQLKDCEAQAVTFYELAELCDVYSPVILDLLRFPGKGGEVEPTTPQGEALGRT